MTEQRSGFAVGLTVFAATMMILVGVLHAVQGVVAVANDTFYVAGQEWIFEFDVTTWGWIHLVAGLVVVLAGFFVLAGAVWARAVGVRRGVPQHRAQLRVAAVLPGVERS